MKRSRKSRRTGLPLETTIHSAYVPVKRGEEILYDFPYSYFSAVPRLARSNKVPVSKLAEINRRGENCSVLDGSLSTETQATSYFLVKKLLDSSKIRVMSRQSNV